MVYRGYKVKEITAIVAFDAPRKMLVWDERGKDPNGAMKVATVSARVRLDAGVFALTENGAFYAHCADIPLEVQLDDANAEIAKLKKALDTVHSGKVIIYRHHDRHTDDNVEIYPYSEENFEKLKLKCQGDWCMNSGFASNAPGKEGKWSDDLTDYEWGWQDTYWSSLMIKDILKI
jgi:hypothetical protein